MGAVQFGFDVRHLTARPFHSDDVRIGLVHVLAVVAGAFMLRGADWARWLAVVWMGFHVAISALNGWRGVVFHAIIFAGITFLLFRADARAWFRRTETKTA